MLIFTLRVIIADIQKSFKGFWIIAYIALLVSFIVVPFYGDSMFPLSYVIYLVFSRLAPHITKVFYVLPLGSKLVRRYIHIRSLLLTLFFLLAGGIMALLGKILHVSSVEKGCLMILLYVQICLVLGLTHTMKDLKKNIPAFVLILLLFVGNIINSIILINFKVQLLISIILIILTEVMLIISLQRVKLDNYIEPIYNPYARIRQGNRLQPKKP